MRAERIFGHALGLQVQAQHQVVAGDRRLRAQVRRARAADLLHRAAFRIDQDLAKAVGPVQLLLVGAFHAELADHRGAGVGGRVDMLQVGLAQCADVAQGVHARARRWDTSAVWRDLMSTPGKSKRCTAKRPTSSSVMRRRMGTLSKLRRERMVRRMSGSSSGGQQADADQALEGGVEVGDFLAHQFQLVAGLPAGQGFAIAVQQQSAGRRNRLDAHAVVLRLLRVVVVARHLQQHQAAGEHQQQDGADGARDQRPLVKQPLFLPVILDAYAAHESELLFSARRARDPAPRSRAAR